MAARSRTLAQIRSDVRLRAAIESELTFYPDATLNRWINESWQDLRQELTNNDVEYYLTSTTGTFTPGVTTGTSHAEIPLPDSAVAVYGVDITVQGRIWSLEPMSFQSRVDYQFGSEATGIPCAFHVASVGLESTTTVGNGVIIVTPAPDSAYAYRIWFLPAWVDVTSDANVFNGLAGCEQWVIWDCAVKAAIRGNDAKGQQASFVRERELAMRRIIKTAKRFTRAGPVRRRDSRTERLWRPRSTSDIYFR